MKTLLVTGTDTDVGKTFVSCLILRQLRQEGLRVGVYKPVCSGVDRSCTPERWDDVEKLRFACDDSGVDADLVCPQRFAAAVAPNVAAELENRTVDDQLLRNGIEAWRDRCDFLLIEGAGGLMCPLSDKSTVLDLAIDLGCPALIVAANRLGVINHTLLTVAAAKTSGIACAGVVLNQLHATGEDASRQSNHAQLQKLLPEIPLLECGLDEKRLAPMPNGSSLAQLFRETAAG